MKRLLGALGLAVIAVALAAPAAAQQGVPVVATKAELARSLVLIANPDQVGSLTAEAAFRRAQEATLLPRGWNPADTLRQRDLAVVASRLGLELDLADLDRAVTRAELDVFSLRQLTTKRDDLATAFSVGRLPIDGIFDEPPDRYISASEF